MRVELSLKKMLEEVRKEKKSMRVGNRETLLWRKISFY